MPITPATTSGGPPPHGQSPWGGIFAKPDKVRQQFVILSEVEKKSPKAISVDLGLATTNLLARMRQGIKYGLDPRSRNARFRLRSITYVGLPQRNLTTLRMTKAFGFCLIIHQPQSRLCDSRDG